MGHYCVSGVRSLCPPGYFGNTTGLASRSCSGACAAGYYCESPSTSRTQHECGSIGLYCPAGSGAVLVAVPGEETIGSSERTRVSTVHCPSSKYCVGGASYPCPAGRFGCATGLGAPECNGPCAPGFYCPSGSDSNRKYPCGNSSVFCPEGAPSPTRVGVGNYSAGGALSSQQSMQLLCPRGSYCVDGVQVRCVLLRRAGTSASGRRLCVDVLVVGLDFVVCPDCMSVRSLWRCDWPRVVAMLGRVCRRL